MCSLCGLPERAHSMRRRRGEECVERGWRNGCSVCMHQSAVFVGVAGWPVTVIDVDHCSSHQSPAHMASSPDMLEVRPAYMTRPFHTHLVSHSHARCVHRALGLFPAVCGRSGLTIACSIVIVCVLRTLCISCRSNSSRCEQASPGDTLDLGLA